MGKCCSKRQEPQPIGYKKAEVGLTSKHSNGGSLDRYSADPNQRGVGGAVGQARADIIRPRVTPCKQLHQLVVANANLAQHHAHAQHAHHREHAQHLHVQAAVAAAAAQLQPVLQQQQQQQQSHAPNRRAGSPRTHPATSNASHSQRSNKIVVALYSYTARESTDVSFMKGDRMEVLDDSEHDWWKVLHLTTLQEGLIPWNFVAVERSVESEDWFFENVSRKEAGKLLLVDENPRGTFLVRPSEHNPRGYSLSVKDWEEGRGHHVKHYKIKPLDNGGFFIATNQTFPTLPALVMAYSKNALGLCHVLSKPCPKPQPDMWDLGPELRDKWEINRTEIQLIRKLGHGNFGEVYYGKWRNKIEVAVKTLRPGTMSTEAFLQEASIMKQFRHRHLVALYAVCSKEEPIYIVQEYMCNGSLLDFLRTGDGKYMQFEDLIYIAAQVASGMEHLESKQLIHRDLAARNVLIGEKNKAKICDFGLARVIEDDEYCPKQGSRFPVKWTAPEAIVYGRFSIKSDVWSYGILLMELFTYGQVPYPGMHGREVIDQVNNGYRMPKPVNHPLPDSIYRLMLQCWDATPEKRPTFEFLNHYFESFNVTSEIPYLEPPTD